MTPKTGRPDISVIIPAYNEAKRLPKTLKIIADFFAQKKFSYELIVVDDGSSDHTKEEVAKSNFKNLRYLKYQTNRGKGYAVNYGVKNARGEVILFADADNSTPFKQLEKLYAYIDEYDVVIGSRHLPQSDIKVKQPLSRRIAAKIGNLLIQLVVLPGFADTQCGFKMFRRQAAKDIFARQTIWRWGFDIEILYIARQLKYKIKEVPVDWYNDEGTRIQSPLVFLSTLQELLQIRINSLKGLYRRD